MSRPSLGPDNVYVLENLMSFAIISAVKCKFSHFRNRQQQNAPIIFNEKYSVGIITELRRLNKSTKSDHAPENNEAHLIDSTTSKQIGSIKLFPWLFLFLYSIDTIWFWDLEYQINVFINLTLSNDKIIRRLIGTTRIESFQIMVKHAV